jgi:hypothetical protein
MLEAIITKYRRVLERATKNRIINYTIPEGIPDQQIVTDNQRTFKLITKDSRKVTLGSETPSQTPLHFTYVPQVRTK